MNSSNTGSSSCSCTTTSYGENKETQKSVRTFQLKLRIMLADSRSDVGLFGDLDQRRKGTELALINQKEIGTKLLNKWCSILQKAVILSFVPPVPLKEENWEAKKRERRLLISPVVNKNIELILRTVMSANQLSIYGAVADICTEVSKDTMASGKPEVHAAQDPLETMEILTEPPTADSRTMNSDGEICCKNTSNNSNNYQTLRSYPNSAPMLVWELIKEDNISSHLIQKDRAERYICAENFRCLETVWDLDQEAGFVIIRKLAQSWTFTFVIMNWKVRKRNDRNHGRRRAWSLRETCCKSKTSNEVDNKADTHLRPLCERKWVDVDPGSYDHECYVKSKTMTWLPRHDLKNFWETDGAIKYEDIVEEFNKKKKKKFDGVSQWPINDWITCLAKEGWPKKRFQYCLNPNSSKHFLHFRAIQGHSGGNIVDPALQDNVLLPKGFTEYIFHVGNVSEIHSTIRSGLNPGGKVGISREESYDRESINGSDSGITEQNKVLVRRQSILRSWIKEQLWSDPRTWPYLNYSESQCLAALRLWIAAWYTKWCGCYRKRFLNDHLPKKDCPPPSSTIQRIWHPPLRETRPRNCCIKRIKRNMDCTHPFFRDSNNGWNWCDIMPFDRIALENQNYVATRAERYRHSELWILNLNQDGPQQPLKQRPDFAQAKRECKILHDECMAKTQQEYRTIPRSQQVRQRKEQQFEGIEEYDYAVDPRTGWRFYKPAAIVLVHESGKQPLLDDKKLEFLAFCTVWPFVNFLRWDKFRLAGR